MKTPRKVTLVAATIAVLCGLAAAWQQSRIRQLEHELARLRTDSVVTADQTNRPAPPVAVALTNASGLDETERLELLRLRAEVTRLHERQRELASARTENAALQARAATDSAAPTAPPGWVRRKDARFAGLETPEATLQSFFWAIEQRNTNALLQALTPEAAQTMQDAMSRPGTEGFWEQGRLVPGFRIVETETRSETEVVVKVEFLPGDKPTEMILRRIGQEWRLAP